MMSRGTPENSFVQIRSLTNLLHHASRSAAIGLVAFVWIWQATGCARKRSACEQDRILLLETMQPDGRMQRALHEADTFATGPKPAAGARIIETRVKTVASAALAGVTRLEVRTRWGQTQKRRLESLYRERLDSATRYEKALSSGDKHRLLAALLEQKRVESHAVQLRRTLRHPPPESSLECQAEEK